MGIETAPLMQAYTKIQRRTALMKNEWPTFGVAAVDDSATRSHVLSFVYGLGNITRPPGPDKKA